MAGIGFTLNKLARQDNLSGTVRAYLHAALIATGPWLLTITAIGSTVLLCETVASKSELEAFSLILIYNFGFSMIISSPICMITTRFLADEIYRSKLHRVPGLLVGSLCVNLLLSAPIAYGIYLGFSNLPTTMACCAAVNYLSISSIWLVAVFLSALRDYSYITRAFAIGLLSGTLVGSALVSTFGGVGLLLGFNVGILTILFLLLGQVFTEYPYPITELFAFKNHFRAYWELAVGALIYNVACWVDKWVMWGAPEAVSTHGLVTYPYYDNAMFLAYLTTIPSLAAFVFKMETEFFEVYTAYYKGITSHTPLEGIKKKLEHMIEVLIANGRNHLLIHGSIVLFTILLAPKLFGWLGVNFLQLSMFRFGVLGAFFHIGALFAQTILAYLDARRLLLLMQCLFLVSNLLFTLLTRELGFSAYGLGYALSTMLTFSVSAAILMHYIKDLNYHTFVTTNTSVVKPPSPSEDVEVAGDTH
jgi:uncharacterized membrane protein